ncbi:MAG: hypothetical protein Ct9H300mP31_08410 [Acidimicrobiaceae bacterium]|nr:MAG: hypothetical protein Ct9H300mP31_08410 [Acidimicrobiaceae bacterium]
MAAQDVVATVLLHEPHVAYASGHVGPAVDSTHAVYQRPVAIIGQEGQSICLPTIRRLTLPRKSTPQCSRN